MTPPTRNMGAPHRVVKKSAKKSAKRDANKAAEARLPGFSIMTKDGVDVTSSAAGRGTKTKEQREHAHLMRIMKACDECKRKKVRVSNHFFLPVHLSRKTQLMSFQCDPSHRSSQPETSTSSTPTSSSGRPNPSPPVSAPPLSRTATQTSPVTSFDDNPIDDFVLFPDEASSSWNPADWSLPDFDENLDLSHFNFDINGLNDMSSPSFDFFDQPATGFQRDHSEPAASLGHPRDPCDLFTYQHGRGEWASSQDVNLSVTHPRALPTCPPESGQTDTSFFDTDFHESPISHTTPTSPVSSFAEHLLPSASVPQPQVAPTSSASRPSGELDWSLIDRSLIPDGDGSLSQSMNRRERRIFSRVERARKAAIQQRVDSVSSAYADESQSNSNSLIERHRPRSFRDSPLDSLLGQGSWNPGATSGGSLDYWDLENTVAIIAESMQVLKSVPGAYRPILQELQRLRNLLQLLKDWSACSERTPLLRQALVAELVILTSQLQVSVTCLKKRYNRLDPEFHPDFLRKSLRQTRQVISALFATINNLTAQDIGNGGSVAATNTSILSSGLRQGAVLPTNLTHYHPQDASVYLSDGSNFILSVGSFSALGSNKTHDIHENVNDTIPVGLDERIYQENDVLGAIPASNGIGSVTLAIVDTPRYRLVTRRAVEPFSRHVELDSANDVLPVVETCATLEPATALARQTVVPTPFGFDALNARRTASESFREHHKEDIAHVQNPTTNDLVVNISLIAAPHTLALQSPCRSQDVTRTPSLSFQSGGSPRSDSLRYSDSSSPGAIPGTALGNIARVNSGCTTSVILDTVSSGILVLASLVLMNVRYAQSPKEKSLRPPPFPFFPDNFQPFKDISLI